MKNFFSYLGFLIIIILLFAACVNDDSNRSIALTELQIIDGTGQQVIEKGTILIANGKIINVVNGTCDLRGYQEIKLSGKTALPGFINAHVHNAYSSENLQTWLKSGVTTVRDLGTWLDKDYISLRNEFNSNQSLARIIAATPLITSSLGYGDCHVSSPEEAESVVTEYINKGIDIIKIVIEDDLGGRRWPLLGLAEIAIICQTAHAANIRVSAHITHVRNLPLALEADIDDFAHMVVEPLPATLINEIIEKGIYWVPTMELWQGISEIHQLNWITIALENLKNFYQAGGKIALGTDYAGYTHEYDLGFPITEIRLMQKAGMSVMDIIVAGTKNAAIVCGREIDLGTLEKGKIADILILNNNPLEDINNFLDPFMILKEGEVVK